MHICMYLPNVYILTKVCGQTNHIIKVIFTKFYIAYKCIYEGLVHIIHILSKRESFSVFKHKNCILYKISFAKLL